MIFSLLLSVYLEAMLPFYDATQRKRGELRDVSCTKRQQLWVAIRRKPSPSGTFDAFSDEAKA
jgi:hypothetical protein